MTFPANLNSGKMAAQWKCHKSQLIVILNTTHRSYVDFVGKFHLDPNDFVMSSIGKTIF